MSKPSTERLYNLLPAIYRIRDSERGEPLRALLAVIENELQAIENDIDDLYRNWFIETCEEWVVPYIGDLLGVRSLHPISSGNFSLRPYVANTLAYRRRKGTATVLEQLAHDVTDWPARAVEFFQLLSMTSHFNHVTLARGQTLNLRDSKNLELLNSPFECAAYTGEVRHINSNRGKYNIPNIGIFLWRLQSYTVTCGTARAVSEPADGRYTFNQLGYDFTLFNPPQTETGITHLAEERNIPGKLRRLPLYMELEDRRYALVQNQDPRSVYFGDKPVLKIFIQNTDNDELKQLLPEEIMICNLSDWQRPINLLFSIENGGLEAILNEGSIPDRLKTEFQTQGIQLSNTTLKKENNNNWLIIDEEKKKVFFIIKKEEKLNIYFKTLVAVDPVLGRLAFPSGLKPSKVEVSYTYGFSGNVGGGPYSRFDSIEKWYDPQDPNQKVTWQMGVMKNHKTPNETQNKQLVETLQKAIEAWNKYATEHPKTFGIIAIMDSSTYKEDLVSQNYHIKIPESSKLVIVAADWPKVADPDLQGREKRIIGQLVPDGIRPHLLGNLYVHGTARSNSHNPGELILDGILIEGKLTVSPGNLGNLLLAHCTLVPAKGGLSVYSSSKQEKQNAHLRISIDHSICGAIRSENTILELRIVDSIVDTNLTESSHTTIKGDAIKVPTVNANIETSTIFGRITVRSLQASSSIFTGRITVNRRQEGCIRFCYLPNHSLTPRRYYCQPDLALKDVSKPTEQNNIRARLTPSFTSMRYGDPAYAQLSLACALEIRTGAEDGSEMGAFNSLKQPQREANLRASLDEYMRFGLEAGIFYVT